ncbi:sigma 54-interacting transcriptional regulator [Thalassoglobus sp.]|uniref:sigma 54-interacting transcriptional regulator n=1 Tax=Thalassoglobus sp. TaxID=2795869 RepID=UPI003AA8097B
MRSGIAFTKDCQLYNDLQKEVCETDISLKFFDQAEEALVALQSGGVSTIFIDVRENEVDAETVSLVKAIANRAVSKLNVITVGSTAFPVVCASELFLISACHLKYGGDRSLQPCGKYLNGIADENSLRELLKSQKVQPIPKLHTLEGGETALKTREPSFYEVLQDLKRIAHRNVTILIIGETGTGKTTLARIIHERSTRRGQPFQHLACGALPGDLIESELFGHVKGSFTGADRNKIGRFQAAGKGTLLLDEIDVLDVKQQAKLLKVIETGEYEMVGSTEQMISEARLITASNINLEDLTESSGFRSDLYYRLSVLEFRLFPLRDRVVDVVPLAMQFVSECCQEHDIEINLVERDFFDALCRYKWPGNIRELKNHVRRAVLFAEDGRLQANDLSSKITQFQFSNMEPFTDLDEKKSLATQVAKNERELLIQALQVNGNNRTQTAKSLGISRVGLYKKLRRHGLIEKDSSDLRKAS